MVWRVFRDLFNYGLVPCFLTIFEVSRRREMAMRPIWNLLSDPTLHFLMIAGLLLFVALTSRGSRDLYAESPLPICSSCKGHFLPNHPCECPTPARIARAAR